MSSLHDINSSSSPHDDDSSPSSLNDTHSLSSMHDSAHSPSSMHDSAHSPSSMHDSAHSPSSMHDSAHSPSSMQDNEYSPSSLNDTSLTSQDGISTSSSLHEDIHSSSSLQQDVQENSQFPSVFTDTHSSSLNEKDYSQSHHGINFKSIDKEVQSPYANEDIIFSSVYEKSLYEREEAPNSPTVHDVLQFPGEQEEHYSSASVHKEIHSYSLHEEIHTPSVNEEIHTPSVNEEIHTPSVNEEVIFLSVHEEDQSLATQKLHFSSVNEEAILPSMQDEDQSPSTHKVHSPSLNEEIIFLAVHEENQSPSVQEVKFTLVNEDNIFPSSQEELHSSSINESCFPSVHENVQFSSVNEEVSSPTVNEEVSSPTVNEEVSFPSVNVVSSPSVNEVSSLYANEDVYFQPELKHVHSQLQQVYNQSTHGEMYCSSEQEIPASQEHEEVPASTEDEEELSSLECEEVHASLEREEVPASYKCEEVPVSLEHEEVPVSLEHEEVPATVEHEEVLASLEHKESFAPLEYEEVPASLEHEEVSASFEHEEISAPLEHEEVPAPLEHEEGFASLEHEEVFAPLQHEEVPAPLEHEEVSASLEHEEVSASLEHEEVPASLEHEEVSASLEHKEVSASLEHEEVSASLEHEEVSALLEHKEVSASLEHEEVSASLEHEEVSASLEHEEVPASLEHKEVFASHEHEEVPASLEHKEVSVSLEHKEIFASLEHEEVLASLEHKEVFASHEHEEVPASLEHEEVSASLEHKEVSAPLEHEEVSAPLEHEEVFTPLKHEEIFAPLEHEEVPASTEHEDRDSSTEHERQCSLSVHEKLHTQSPYVHEEEAHSTILQAEDIHSASTLHKDAYSTTVHEDIHSQSSHYYNVPSMAPHDVLNMSSDYGDTLASSTPKDTLFQLNTVEEQSLSLQEDHSQSSQEGITLPLSLSKNAHFPHAHEEAHSPSEHEDVYSPTNSESAFSPFSYHDSNHSPPLHENDSIFNYPGSTQENDSNDNSLSSIVEKDSIEYSTPHVNRYPSSLQDDVEPSILSYNDHSTLATELVDPKFQNESENINLPSYLTHEKDSNTQEFDSLRENELHVEEVKHDSFLTESLPEVRPTYISESVPENSAESFGSDFVVIEELSDVNELKLSEVLKVDEVEEQDFESYPLKFKPENMSEFALSDNKFEELSEPRINSTAIISQEPNLKESSLSPIVDMHTELTSLDKFSKEKSNMYQNYSTLSGIEEDLEKPSNSFSSDLKSNELALNSLESNVDALKFDNISEFPVANKGVVVSVISSVSESEPMNQLISNLETEPENMEKSVIELQYESTTKYPVIKESSKDLESFMEEEQQAMEPESFTLDRDQNNVAQSPHYNNLIGMDSEARTFRSKIADEFSNSEEEHHYDTEVELSIKGYDPLSHFTSDFTMQKPKENLVVLPLSNEILNDAVFSISNINQESPTNELHTEYIEIEAPISSPEMLEEKKTFEFNEVETESDDGHMLTLLHHRPENPEGSFVFENETDSAVDFVLSGDRENKETDSLKTQDSENYFGKEREPLEFEGEHRNVSSQKIENDLENYVGSTPGHHLMSLPKNQYDSLESQSESVNSELLYSSTEPKTVDNTFNYDSIPDDDSSLFPTKLASAQAFEFDGHLKAEDLKNNLDLLEEGNPSSFSRSSSLSSNKTFEHILTESHFKSHQDASDSLSEPELKGYNPFTDNVDDDIAVIPGSAVSHISSSTFPVEPVELVAQMRSPTLSPISVHATSESDFHVFEFGEINENNSHYKNDESENLSDFQGSDAGSPTYKNKVKSTEVALYGMQFDAVEKNSTSERLSDAMMFDIEPDMHDRLHDMPDQIQNLSDSSTFEGNTLTVETNNYKDTQNADTDFPFASQSSFQDSYQVKITGPSLFENTSQFPGEPIQTERTSLSFKQFSFPESKSEVTVAPFHHDSLKSQTDAASSKTESECFGVSSPIDIDYQTKFYKLNEESSSNLLNYNTPGVNGGVLNRSNNPFDIDYVNESNLLEQNVSENSGLVFSTETTNGLHSVNGASIDKLNSPQTVNGMNSQLSNSSVL
ncbi:uro-adherence factor A-like isoform X1 [Procambarus clarkii]|uniref:uro-adherence factor A-like isoform X1 n=1 Tax=Procambarus clarkii TaxID=6728 RepID=UPI0037444D43